MPTMNVSLSETTSVFAERQASQAGYADVTTYLESLVERANEQETARSETLAGLHEGLADVSADRTRPAQDVFQDLATKYARCVASSGSHTPCAVRILAIPLGL